MRCHRESRTMIDHIKGSDADNGYTMEVRCPSCPKDHRVTITRLGRFMFTCNGDEVSGTVENWKKLINSAQLANPSSDS